VCHLVYLIQLSFDEIAVGKRMMHRFVLDIADMEYLQIAEIDNFCDTNEQ